MDEAWMRRKIDLEFLESRQFLSASIGSDGFTHFTKSADTRVIYVSSSTGNDKNNGLSQNAAVKTLAHAESLMRDGEPDWLLLKAGDTFNTGFAPWKTSGRNAQEMQVIGTYGSGARPIIDSGVTEGFVTFGGTGHPINDVAITGLNFVANTYNGKNGSFSTTGIRLTRQGTNWLIENCRIDGYKDDITLDADGTGISNFTLRRSEVLDSYVASSKVGNGESQGIYIGQSTTNAVIEQNVIDHDGWKAGVAGANATEFNHDIYVHAGASNTTIDGNIISQASLCGVVLRSTGTVENNVIIRCPVGIQADASGTISGNVILDGTDLEGTSGGATGIEVEGSNINITNNTIAHELSSAKYHVTGIRIDSGVKNATISGNLIYDWQQSINNDGTSNITIKNNVLQDTDTTAPLLAQVPAANTSQYHYSGNIYGTPRSDVNQLDNKNVTLSSWISATKETGAKSEILRYANAKIDVASSFTTWINSERSQTQASWNSSLAASSVISLIDSGFKIV